MKKLQNLMPVSVFVKALGVVTATIDLGVAGKVALW